MKWVKFTHADKKTPVSVNLALATAIYSAGPGQGTRIRFDNENTLIVSEPYEEVTRAAEMRNSP
jgi:hypothetical protein